MSTFERLPRELRDLIYEFVAADEQPLLVLSSNQTKRLVSRPENAALLFTNTQMKMEYEEVLTKNASIALCYGRDGDNVDDAPTVPPALARRATSLTAVIDLDGLKPQDWVPGDDHAVLGPRLQSILEKLDRTLKTFPDLKSIEVHWWNDLSTAKDRDRMGEWTSALIASGLVRTHELWFGYLGGRFNQPAELSKHFLSHANHRNQAPRRLTAGGKLDLLSN